MDRLPPSQTEEHHKGDVHEFMDDVRRFWDKFGTTVLFVVLGVLLVIVTNRYFKGRQTRALEAAYGDLAAAKSPFEMVDVAEKHRGVPGFTGMALFEAAKLRQQEAQGLIFTPGADAKVGDADRTKGLEQAADLYNRVVKLNVSSLQVLNARMGLASVLESQGQFDQAKAQYEAVVKEGESSWPPLAQRAKLRLESLDQIKVAVTFPPPKPKEEKPAEGEKKSQAPTEKGEQTKPAETKPADTKPDQPKQP